jgi:hypothetical protein
MQNVIRKRAEAREARLRSYGCSLCNGSFSRVAGRTGGGSTDGSTGNKPAYNSDCAGLGMALIGTPLMFPVTTPRPPLALKPPSRDRAPVEIVDGPS